MILAGFQKNSFIDFPGKIGCVLFTTGCNFACPYCHNADLARGEYPARIESSAVMDFLKSRRGLLDGVVISGGEPTLNPGLFDLCRAVKSLGYPVKLDTNGSRPEIIRQLLRRHLVDFIAMDIKAPLNEYHPFSPDPEIPGKLKKSVRLIMDAAPAYEFRTTCAAPFVNAKAIRTIAESIAGAACYVLQSLNRNAVCLDPVFNTGSPPGLFEEELHKVKTLISSRVQRILIR
jgi:pyruvate formate lyase activating enzyme